MTRSASSLLANTSHPSFRLSIASRKKPAISFQAIEILEQTVDGFNAFARTDGDQREMFDKVTGQPSIRRDLMDGRPVRSIVRSWNSGVSSWAVERLPFLIYGRHPSTVVSDAPGQ